MSAVATAQKALRNLIFGPPDYPQQVIIGMREPQTEVSVRLRRVEESNEHARDVTNIHMMACAAPFTVGVGAEDGAAHGASARDRGAFTLEFFEREGKREKLGKILLRPSGAVKTTSGTLQLFQTEGSKNYCLPSRHIWARYLEYAYFRWKQPSPDVEMKARDVHAMCVYYNCPRPVGLVSVSDGNATNIFPMNLMGAIGGSGFAFALNTGKPVTLLIERARRIALSTVPFPQAKTAYGMAPNHKKESIDAAQLPFAVRRSAEFGFPVPEFALRLREMEVEAIERPGSHTLFVARVVRDENCATAGGDNLEFFTLHGIYQARREPKPP
jgi:flavin reductase (DIM6/NTAB) family NADH-FMN oxidoreductase RutF